MSMLLVDVVDLLEGRPLRINPRILLLKEFKKKSQIHQPVLTLESDRDQIVQQLRDQVDQMMATMATLTGQVPNSSQTPERVPRKTPVASALPPQVEQISASSFSDAHIC